MIHITKGQPVLENSGMKVFSATGNYSDNELIECCSVEDPALAICTYQAQFIAYGGVVYRYNTPQELGEELLKIDPDSTHTAASFVRMSKELLAQMDSGSLEPASLDQVISSEQSNVEDQMDDTSEDEASTTEPVEDIPDISTQGSTASSTATSTPSVSGDSSATTTPAIDADTASSTPAISSDAASSTPALAPDNALGSMSSTTPQPSATTTSGT